MSKKIMINQTLHGYSNGHHLLESSILLSDESKRKMDILSDLSGSDLTKGFENYYSGYFLENEQMLVFAKTWYANEMSRPGCVWTHSLLLKINDIGYFIQYSNDLLSFFLRPNLSKDYVNYSMPFEAKPSLSSHDKMSKKKVQYLLWVMLGQEPPNIIASDHSAEYINELLYLWLMCYNALPTDYSFITGAMSIRSDRDKFISLQFIPNEFRSIVQHNGKRISIMKNIDDVVKFPQWVLFSYDIVKHNEWSSFILFRRMFGIDYIAYKYLTSFLKLYSVFLGKNGYLNIYESLELIEKLFPAEKSDVGNKLLYLYFEKAFSPWGEKISFTNTIIATLKFEWISISDDMLSTLISNGFTEDQMGAKKVVKYLVGIEYSKIQQLYLSQYASLLTADIIEKFSDMDYSICSVLITLNPSIAECAAFWKQSENYQKGIMESLKLSKNNNSLNIKIIYTVLDNSVYDFSSEIYTLWEQSAIPIFLEYILQIRSLPHLDIKPMFKLCKMHSQLAAYMLENQYGNLSNKQICILLSIIDPYSDRISVEILIEVFKILNIEELDSEQKNNLADFYLPIILMSSVLFPNYIAGFAANNIHKRLGNFSYPEDKWASLQSFLPEVSWLNQWDKCKRVRKAMKKRGYNIKNLDKYSDNVLDIFLL